MAGLYDLSLTRRERRELRKMSPAYQREFLRNRYQQINRRRILEYEQAKQERKRKDAEAEQERKRKAAEAEQERKRKAEEKKAADSEMREWRKSLFDDKDNKMLKQYLAAQGFDAMTGDIPVGGEMPVNDTDGNVPGVDMQENPDLTKLKGMLRGVPDLSRENIAEHIARIALQNRPDIYSADRIRTELTPFLAENTNAADVLASFQNDPARLAGYITRKGSGMTNRDAYQAVMNSRNPAPPADYPGSPRIAPAPSGQSAPASRSLASLGNPIGNLMEKLNRETRRHALNHTTPLPVRISDPEQFRRNFLNTGTMRRHLRRQEAERRREQDALGLSQERFNEIRAKTAAAKRERLENGEARFLIAQNEYEKAKRNGQPVGAAPDRREFIVNAMNIGRTIPNTDPAYRYYSPNAAALAEQPYSYGSREFYPGLRPDFTPEEVERRRARTAETEQRINPRIITPSLSALSAPSTPSAPSAPSGLPPVPKYTPPSVADAATMALSPLAWSSIPNGPTPVIDSGSVPVRQSDEAEIAERRRQGEIRKQAALAYIAKNMDAVEEEKRRRAEEDRKNVMNLYMTGGF